MPYRLYGNVLSKRRCFSLFLSCRHTLKIGNTWNVITIIASSQNNPLKVIAEFVENSIDAKAKNITIIRGKNKEDTHLKIVTVCNPFFRSTNVLGSFWFGMKKLDGPFFYLEGDTIFEREMVKEVLEAPEDCVLSVLYGGTDEEAMKVIISGNRLLDISKNIPLEKADGEFIGLAKFSHKALIQFKQYTDKRIRAEEFSDYFEYVLRESVHQNDPFTYKFIDIDGRYCCEIDFPEDYDFAVENFKA